MSDSAMLWTVVRQAPLSMGFSRQEYWSGLPCPPPGDLTDPEIESVSPALQAGSLPTEPPGKPKLGLRRAQTSDDVAIMKAVEQWSTYGQDNGAK